MIKLDFSLAIATYFFLVILLVLVPWIFYNLNRKEHDRISQDKHMQQCPYCLSIFFDEQENNLKVCPHCESYIAMEEKPYAKK